MKHILSFSGGKDSTFLLLELIRRKLPLDEVVFFDTGWEFAAMYEHIEKCKKICEENGITFVTLHSEKPFDYWMFDHVAKDGDIGFSWCGGLCRWGTRLKIKMYEHLDRLSCKFCKNKNLKELRNIRKYYPAEWQELKDYQSRTERPYKGCGQSVFDLEKRFAFEDERTAAGLSITNRDFFTELRKLCS